MKDARVHEITFCSRVSKWSEEIFRELSDIPFTRTEIEESKQTKLKRSDLRIYEGNHRNPVIAGEVKMPGTVDGRNPYNYELVDDAFLKASKSGAKFCFTWNVNKLVLFDLSQWEKPIIERRVHEFDLGLALEKSDEVERPDVEASIRKFLRSFYEEVALIVQGKKVDWGMPPDLVFIKAFESHIDWSVKLTRDFIIAESNRNMAFDSRLQEWMANSQGWYVVRNDHRVWRILVDRAARTLCYVFANRLIFYESVRINFTSLRGLRIPTKVIDRNSLYKYFANKFQGAVEVTCDYETLFYPEPEGDDWAGPLIFAHKSARDAWASVLENLRPFNFKRIPTDVLGGIFKRLIAPEERHRFGQHYTNEDLVDLINSFCIRRGNDCVLDPACGSGSFLVRAYHRKKSLEPNISHQERLLQIYGVDISLFAAHLSTLNLAAREISDKENYPLIARRNFFETVVEEPFYYIPSGPIDNRRIKPVFLPKFDAIVGNPPYVRQEYIPKKREKSDKPYQSKEELTELIAKLWPGLQLSGRSDLHCYFWPTATAKLKEGGWFGFLISSSWLDVEYGFKLQKWILENFCVHAIFESTAEPWFEDARVKTCAIIMQRRSEKTRRMKQLVKFVRLDIPLRNIFGDIEDEEERQKSISTFRNIVTRTKKDKITSRYRVIVKSQRKLWEDGLKAGRIFELQKRRQKSHTISDISDNEKKNRVSMDDLTVDYSGGKWGKYLRAPDLYFRVMENYGNCFVALGEITETRFGVKSGCDGFFMPKNITIQILKRYDQKLWKNAPLYTPCKRKDVESGKLVIVQDSQGVIHPIEQRYLAPEVHSLMNVKRPIVRACDLKRLILLVSDDLSDLKGTYVAKYLRYGKKSIFSSRKSKAVPIPKRSTCAGRDPWYDLTYTSPGAFFWPMAQQYRHVVPANPERLICNHNLFDVHPIDLSDDEIEVLQAIVNSSMVAYFKTFYGRYAGTEGNLKTEVVDVNLMEIPNPKHALPEVRRKLLSSFAVLCQRDTNPMVEEAFMQCHSSIEAAKLAKQSISIPEELRQLDRRSLDLAIFELIGVHDIEERERLCDELYQDLAAYFRKIRIVEIIKQEQRSGGKSDRIRVEDLAKDIWDALNESEKLLTIDWLRENIESGEVYEMSDKQVHLTDVSDMFDATTVFFSYREKNSTQTIRVDTPSRVHAEFIAELATDGIHNTIILPDDQDTLKKIFMEYQDRKATLGDRFLELARSRTSDENKVNDILRLLFHWLAQGK